MVEENCMSTCLICKNDLVSKINIFKTRTNISKTLLSSKLSKIVQDQFSPDMDLQDICTSCSSLLNLVDECECKLMALENEVKLKYKMPFAIEVQSRLPGGPPPEEPPPAAPPPVGRVEELGVSMNVQQPRQQHNVISIPDGGAYGNTNIVIHSSQVKVDTDGNMVIYREPASDKLGQAASMPYLEDPLDECDPLRDDDRQSDLSAPESEPEPKFKQSLKRKRRTTKPGRSDQPSGRHGNKAVSFTCFICNEDFACQKYLTAHMATHAGNKKNRSCGFCERSFTNHMHLHKHWNEEHPQQLLPCPHCEQRFVTKSTLRRHMTIHKEPRFSCEFCARPFHAPGDLRKHVLIKHTDKKNFECSTCSMKFKLNWMVVRHRVRVHGTAT